MHIRLSIKQIKLKVISQNESIVNDSDSPLLFQSALLICICSYSNISSVGPTSLPTPLTFIHALYIHLHYQCCSFVATVTRATTIAQLLYAFPACWGLTTEKDRARLDKLYNFIRIKRMDYLPDNAPTFPSLVGQADERLFRSIELNPSHVLRDLLPPKAKRPYKLRPRAHDYVLPIKNLKNFVPRYLYQLSMNPSLTH